MDGLDMNDELRLIHGDVCRATQTCRYSGGFV